MSTCCQPKQKEPLGACPSCGEKLKAVQKVTLDSLLLEEAKAELLPEDYSFCSTPSCELVYVSHSGKHIVSKSRLKVRVGIKEKEDPIPLCYCFGFSRADIFKEVEEKGDTEIPAYIRGKVKAGECFCERSNPSGGCCLGDVGRAVKEAKALVRV